MFACGPQHGDEPSASGGGEGGILNPKVEWALVAHYGDQKAASGDRLTIPSQQAGAGPQVLAIEIENTSEHDIELTSDPTVVLWGADADLFTLMAQPETSLAAGGKLAVELSFDPPEGRIGTLKGGVAIAWGREPWQRFTVGLDAEVLEPEYVDVPFVVAVGEGGRIAVSWTRGDSWHETLETSDPIADADGEYPNHGDCFDRCWRSVSYLRDRFLLIGFDEAVDGFTDPPMRAWQSFDGQEWTPVDIDAASMPAKGIASPSGTTAFVGGVRAWFWQPPEPILESWHFGYADGGSSVNDLVWHDGVFVAVGDGARRFRSFDGVGWELQADAEEVPDLLAVAAHGDRIVAVGRKRRRMVSLDGGATWQNDVSENVGGSSSCTKPGNWCQLGWDGAHFVSYEAYEPTSNLTAAYRWTSSDGISWNKEETNGPHANIVVTKGLAAGIGKYPYRSIVTSKDGLDFVKYEPESDAMKVRDIAVGQLQFRKDKVADRLPGYAP